MYLTKTKGSLINYNLMSIPYDENNEFKLKLEWCIKYEYNNKKDYLNNRISIISDNEFILEKIEKDKFYENYKYDEK